jgi:hypothetical protein
METLSLSMEASLVQQLSFRHLPFLRRANVPLYFLEQEFASVNGGFLLDFLDRHLIPDDYSSWLHETLFQWR